MKKQQFSLLTAASLFAGIGVQAADPVISDPAATSLGTVRGGDPDEGLDLTGKFIYALGIGADPTLDVKIGDAQFKGLINNEVAGATLVAGNRNPNWYVVDYGESENDNNLELATSSIRWSDANAAIKTVSLTLTGISVGAQYKAQLMFGEQCCNRGFDVYVDGKLIVKDFNPGVQHEGIANGFQEALITHTFTASKATLDVVMDGTTASADYTDHNAIFNGITLEEVGAAGDSDSDGLPDPWEQLYFQGLSQTGAGDPDADGLNNTDELAAGADPTKTDTDSDGLNDNDEVKTHRTGPTAADTDSDGLTDRDEVITHKSDPLKADGDGDLLTDALEINQYRTD